MVVHGDRALQADVVDRQHVGAQLVEDEEHLGGPAADALDLDERGDQRVVVELAPRSGIERARFETRREIAQVVDLAPRQPAVAQRSDARGGDDDGIEARRTPSISRRASTVATKRRQIDSAALTEICWPTIARASVVNGSWRRRRWMSG